MAVTTCKVHPCMTIVPEGRPVCYFHVKSAKPLPNSAIVEVAQLCGLTVEDIRGPRRDQLTVAARREVICRMLSSAATLTEIGRAIGRDHSTVCYHRDRIYLDTVA